MFLQKLAADDVPVLRRWRYAEVRSVASVFEQYGALYDGRTANPTQCHQSKNRFSTNKYYC